mmetsp:Transcript_26604/g.46891  ORF Transcript_26604/g.46891 Transcript_26604/m.46891 type:complete len:126 (+) Transcript_26604:171-548(+)
MPYIKGLFGEFWAFHWVFVYTLEAHAVDEWPISSARADPSGKPVQIEQHRTMEDRLMAARSFHADFQLPFEVIADTIDNRLEELFCTWPFRFYVLRFQQVVFQAQPKDCTYSLELLAKCLRQLAT